MESELDRAREEIVERLRARGVDVGQHESSEDVIRLLEAVEAFERTVQRGGGDLMVDEPIGDARPLTPDAASFVLPSRAANESIEDFIARIAVARDRASHADRPRE